MYKGEEKLFIHTTQLLHFFVSLFFLVVLSFSTIIRLTTIMGTIAIFFLLHILEILFIFIYPNISVDTQHSCVIGYKMRSASDDHTESNVVRVCNKKLFWRVNGQKRAKC